jgi:hypothetical protein
MVLTCDLKLSARDVVGTDELKREIRAENSGLNTPALPKNSVVKTQFGVLGLQRV